LHLPDLVMFLLHPSCYLCNRPAVLQPFPATIQTVRPFPLHLIALQFPTVFTFLLLLSRAAQTSSRGVQILPNLSKNPWTDWGLFLWQLPEAQAALHKEWWSGKVGNVTMVECTDGAQASFTPLYPSLPLLQIVPEMSKDPWTKRLQIVPKMSKGYPIV